MLRNYRQMLYSYRRVFGTPVRLNKLNTTTRTLSTGTITKSYTQYRIFDAVVLPIKQAWQMFPHSILQTFSDRIMEVEPVDTAFYIEISETITLDWIIEYQQKQYKIVNIQSLGGFGFLLAARSTPADLIGALGSSVDSVSFGENLTYEHIVA